MYKTYLKSKSDGILRGILSCLCLLTVFMIIPGGKTLSASEGTTARATWRQLLYYSPRVFSSANSLVDSPEFFLAPDGHVNSEHELEAFLIALQKDDPKLPEQERISCRFPARTSWVRRNRPFLKIPDIKCPEFENWLQISKPKAVSLIFSSYFINNPSSMMGHTFLRLRRGSATSAPLLDKAVNFAAEPTTNTPILYTIMGLTGSFPGKFGLMPYYSKVQEYANAESRDLWEYDLNFSEAETRNMMESLWELAPTRIDYYFFDENCSAILLFLIQTARPGLAMSQKLGFWVHPSDTIRILMEEPGLVSEVVYRPSTRSRYLAQYEQLNASEKLVVHELIRTQDESITNYQTLPDERKAMVLDATLAFIEFDESLYGSKKPVRYDRIYEKALNARAPLKGEPMTSFPTPRDEAPHLGHKGQRWGLGIGRYEDANEGIFEYRPGPHDLLSPAIGYPPELSIELGKTRIALEEGGNVRVRSAELFHILSLNPSRSGRFPWSWQMGLDYENTESKRVQLLASLGQAFSGDERDHFLFAFFDTRLKAEREDLWICPGATVGGRYSFGKRLVQLTTLSLERCYSEDTRPWLGQWSHAYRWSLNDVWEIYLEGKRNTDSKEFSLGFYRYY